MTEHDVTEHDADPESEASKPNPSRATAYPPPTPSSPPRENPTTRTPILAALLSVFPGLGNVYNGLYLRGATIFLICFGLIALASGTQPPEAVLLVFAVIFVWLFNLFDAYRQATLINFGYTPADPAPTPRPAPYGSGGMVAGIAVFLLGFYGLLREHFHIDLTLLVDYWYVLFMAFGGFLVAQTVLERRKESEDAEDSAIE